VVKMVNLIDLAIRVHKVMHQQAAQLFVLYADGRVRKYIMFILQFIANAMNGKRVERCFKK